MTDKPVTYPPCHKCGAAHGMGIETMATGEIEPIDLCYNCLWSGFKINEPTKRINFDKMNKDPDPNIMLTCGQCGDNMVMPRSMAVFWKCQCGRSDGADVKQLDMVSND